MKKILSVFFLSLFVLQVPAEPASQWTVGDPQGTEANGTIDNLIRINQEALDRLLNGYRRGLGINYVSANALSVLAGEIAIPNAAVSIVRFRETTAATSVTWDDIDTGAEESSKTYYIYLTADTDITGVVEKISLSSTSPSGSTYYVKIGEFYNNSSGNIERLISYRPDNGTDYQDVVKGWAIITVSGTVAILDSYNVSSVVDDAAGQTTVVWDTDFGGTSYSAVSTNGSTTSSAGGFSYVVNRAAASCRVESVNEAGVLFDPPSVSIIAIGDRT